MKGVTAIGAISHTLCLRILLAIGGIKGDNRILTITSRTVLVYYRTTREDMSHRIAQKCWFNLFPMDKVTTDRMSPVHISPHGAVRIILITEVVDPVFIKHSNRIVHPSVRRGMMVRRTIIVGIGNVPHV